MSNCGVLVLTATRFCESWHGGWIGAMARWNMANGAMLELCWGALHSVAEAETCRRQTNRPVEDRQTETVDVLYSGMVDLEGCNAVMQFLQEEIVEIVDVLWDC